MSRNSVYLNPPKDTTANKRPLEKVGRPDIDAFKAVMMREERMLGYFVGFEFTGDAMFEIDRFRRKEGREIRPMTVREILDEEVAEAR